MKYVYTGGAYTEFRGHVFAYGKPTTITDRATEEALLKRDDFTRYQDEEVKRQGRQGQETLLTEEQASDIVDSDACPKCGKVVRQGRYMHVKYCLKEKENS